MVIHLKRILAGLALVAFFGVALLVAWFFNWLVAHHPLWFAVPAISLIVYFAGFLAIEVYHYMND